MDKKTEEKRPKKKSILLDIILVLFILVFIGCGIYLLRYYHDINKTEKGFNEIAELIIEDDTLQDEDSDKYDTGSSTDAEEVKYIMVDGKRILARYSEIYKRNNDFAAWIKIPGTKIDYPVMFTPNNLEYYLRRDFDGNYCISGTLFIDDRDNIEEMCDNTIIYGHHMKSGTMFGSLESYEDVKFFREHKYIYFDTIYKMGTYEVIAAFRTQLNGTSSSGYNPYSLINAENKEEFDSFVSTCQSLTPYSTGNTAEYGDKLITLSTCAYHVANGRYIVVAKRIE